MAKINSKQKGKRGELEFVNYLKSQGIEARRGQQYSGTPDSPDVVSDLRGFHFEVKRTERFNIYKAMEQAENDCGCKVPVVVHRQNSKDWLIVMNADDWLDYCILDIEKLKCLRCGYEWFPRSTFKPKHCSKCNSPYWDKPRSKKGYV